MKFDLTFTLKRERKDKKRAEEHIQDTRRSSIEEFKASPTFAKEMARVVEAFRAFEEYCNSHVTFNEKIFYQAHKEGWPDYWKLIEEEHPELYLAFLDYEDEEKDGEHFMLFSSSLLLRRRKLSSHSPFQLLM